MEELDKVIQYLEHQQQQQVAQVVEVMVVMVHQVMVLVLQEQQVQPILVAVAEEVIIMPVIHPHLFLIQQHKIDVYLEELEARELLL